ncbi:MAG: rubrerythrin family protein, partial [Candidatus Bathyarchaeota archaeon]
YLAFSRKAEKEGLLQIAKLFKAAAEAETIHALNHLEIAGEVKTTAENIETAISGETFEFTAMYPDYLAKAKKGEYKQAAWSFDVANKVEQIHADLFSKAIKNLKEGKKIPDTDYFVCSVCGNTVEGEAPEKCSICGAPKKKFFKVA